MKNTDFGLEFTAQDPEWGQLQSDAAWRENRGMASALARDEIIAIKRAITNNPAIGRQWAEMVDTWLDISSETDMPTRAAMQLARISFIGIQQIPVHYSLSRDDLAA
jgi:hypothetical protein